MRNSVVAYSNASNSEVDCVLVEALPPLAPIAEELPTPVAIALAEEPPKLAKPEIRRSLSASTIDGVFSSIFVSTIGGVLLSNFLLQLGANSVEIGMMLSFPMLGNLLQPLGAYLSNRSQSRFRYNLSIFGPSRLIWLILTLGIWIASTGRINSHQLVNLTLVLVLASNVFAALGNPSWLDWMAALVPQQLRGRYFGFRNRSANLTNLISGPLLGLAVAAWPGGPIAGYGAVLFLGVVAGVISLVCQFFMTDINPQVQAAVGEREGRREETNESSALLWGFDRNFLKFLLYFGCWGFAANTSSPFFNLYLLDDLNVNVSLVTFYNSFSAGANLFMMVVWGKLADRIGNRPVLLMVGILVAVTPILWVGTAHNWVSLWILLPLLHLLTGGTWAAIDLCNNNIQMSLAPVGERAKYFGVAAAVAGISGALGTTAGGFLAQCDGYGGLPGLFALSSALRLIALLPLVLVREQRSHSVASLMQFLPEKMQKRISDFRL